MSTSIPKDFVPCPTPDGQFADLVGPLYMKRDASGLCFGILIERRHCNVRGNVHGGMLMTLADQILGMTVVEALGYTSLVTITLNNEFFAAANAGDWLSGRAEIIRRTILWCLSAAPFVAAMTSSFIPAESGNTSQVDHYD